MASKTVEELNQLFDKLKNATFTGVGTSKWYLPGSETAYYRMEYSPGKFVLRHKSPSDPREERFDVRYCGIDDLNYTSIEIYIGENLYQKYFKDDLNGLPVDDKLKLMNKCGFKDPRWMLGAAETVREITVSNPDTKVYSIKVFDESSYDPLFGLTVFAELTVESGTLKMMRVRKFIGGKEIVSQNMDIKFQF